jgi:hypothetical protein
MNRWIDSFTKWNFSLIQIIYSVTIARYTFPNVKLSLFYLWWICDQIFKTCFLAFVEYSVNNFYFCDLRDTMFLCFTVFVINVLDVSWGKLQMSICVFVCVYVLIVIGSIFVTKCLHFLWKIKPPIWFVQNLFVIYFSYSKCSMLV